VTSPSELLDKDAIGAVLVRYCHLLDTRGFASLAGEVFSADASFGDERGSWRGGREIAARIEAAMRPFEGTAHVLGNVVIDVEGDAASSSASITAWHWLHETAPQGAGRPADWVMVGAYRDRLVREARGWRICQRRFERIGPGLVAVGRPPKLER
jgi:hypothetical protein